MHLFTSLTSLLLAVTPTLAIPTGSDPFQFLSVSLQLSGGPASYILNLKADGNTYYTNNPLQISSIQPLQPSTGFNIYYKCNIYTSSPKSVSPSGSSGGVDLGPPQAVTGIVCQPTSSLEGGCLPVYSTCSWSSDQGGVFLSSCCSGYCAASKCRAT